MRDTAIQKPTILFIVPAIAHEGISKQVLLQINALQNRNYPVYLLALTSINTSVLAEFAPGIRQDHTCELHQPDAYLSVKSLLFSVSAAKRYNYLLNKIKPEIVFAHAPYAHFVTRIGALISNAGQNRVKLWQYFHSMQYSEFPVNNWRRKVLNSFNRWMAKRFDYGHVFVSKAVCEDVYLNLVRLDRSEVIYNVLPEPVSDDPCSILNTRPMESVFTILIPGRIEEAKGQLWVLEAISEFIAKDRLTPELLQVIIVGEGSQRLKLERRIAQMQLQPFVKLLGRLPNKDLLCKMKESDLVVVPSFYEGLSLVLLESLQQEVPVLASDILPNREVIFSTEIGFLFKAGQIADCVEKLSHIYQNRGKELINVETVKQHLNQHFSFEKHMQDLVSIIESDL